MPLDHVIVDESKTIRDLVKEVREAKRKLLEVETAIGAIGSIIGLPDFTGEPDGDVLTILGGLPSWETPAPSGGGSGGWDEILVASADEDVTNSTTFVDHTQLQFPVVSGGLYYVELLASYNGSDTTGDYKCQFAFPSSIGWYAYIAYNNTADSAVQLSTGIRFVTATSITPIQLGATGATTVRLPLKIDCFIRTGSAGTFSYQFANNAAAAGRISRTHQGSILQYKLIGA